MIPPASKWPSPRMSKRISINDSTKNCHGTKPLSPSTALRILSVCTANVRKSLQGLDYISADGAKAFDDLAGLLTKLKNHGYDQVLINSCEAALKAGKQYIKTDYKVIIL